MNEPVGLQDFFLTFFPAAMVILTGALDALRFAYARVRQRPRLMPPACVAHLGLVASVLAMGPMPRWSSPCST